MFEDRDVRKQFLSAPPTIASAIAAVMEPLIAVLCLAVLHRVCGLTVSGVAMAMMLLTLVLLFPGVNRFNRRGVGVLIDISLNWARCVVILGVVGYVTGGLDMMDRRLLLYWVLATPILQASAVWVGHQIVVWHSASPQARRPVVIVGAGPIALRLVQAMRRRPDLSYDLLCIFDDRTPDRLSLPDDVALRGPLSELPAFIDKHGVKDVFVTLPLTSQPRILNLMQMLQNTTASLYYVPDVFGVTVIQGRLEDMGGLPVVGLHLTPFSGINGLLKRASDLVLAALILVLISPVLLAVAIGVKLSSPGPVLFKQRRTGLDGEIIEVYKFRSMLSMDNGAVVKQATRDDPRITKFGAFIRKTSLDELPQFVNVLQGRMSIVGPRPHAVAHNEQYRKIVRAYMARHKVKPGITGWAQVNGLRGETDTVDKMARRVEFDLEYLRNWSLGLDLLIIARTAKLMFFDRSAY
ncbi:undecaprenyl-phosphate glucose phosphotransferase [Ideonella sp.]|jgi:putative colanic acid biosynthesis UDP-glucose lipid carrier transferase|uniref:undecaprenyl-phosphate glucose phosphotransferase n=1 Tax=Ideonella sp. TaxID=1929293 RepID=UPI0037C02610